MKRKRGHGKRKPKKPPVVGANEAHQNVVTLNKEDNSGLGDFDAAEYDSVMEADMPPTAGTDQPDKFANSNLDELVDKTVRQVFCGRAKVSHRTSKSDYQPTSDVPTQSDTDKNRQQLPSGKQVVVTEEMEDSANSLREIKVAISGNPSNKAGSIKRKSSRGLVSSSINRTTNAEVEQGERPHPKEPNVPLLDPQYNMQELNAALAVIKKVMKIDAAEPFNVPVNPITLGIPDYFDVIDTPMDFGTICRNLENGVKYMNSEDVFKDVQYIWENCYKYNNKGDYIMELMKRVRKNFTKYWAAAGLYSEQSRSTNGNLHLPPSMDTAMRPSRHVPRCPVGPMNGSPSQQQDQLGSSQQQDQLGPSHHQKDRLGPSQNQQPPTGYGQAYRTPLSSSLPQPSQPLSAHSHSLPCTDSAMRCNRCVPSCPVGPIIGSTHQHQQDQSGLSQPQSQKPPPSYSQLQPSQRQASANTESAGHSYFSPPTDSASRHIRHVTRFPVGPMTSNPIQQQPEDQPGPTKSHHHQPQQPPPSYIQQYQPQSSSSQLPPSLPQVAMDSESAGHFHLTPPTDSAIRRRRYVPRCPVGPMTVNPCKQQKDHPGWSHPHPQHSQHSPPSCCHSYQPQRSSGQPQVIADTGHSHLPPPTDSVMRRRRYVPRCPVGPMTFSPCKEQQDHSGWSHCPPQHPQHSPPSCSHSHQPQRSSGQSQAIADTGHSHLPPPTDSAMRPRRYVPRCPVGPMTVNPCKQPQDRSGWSHPQPQHPQHSPPSCSQPYQPQLSSGQPQTITDTDSALRHNRHVPTCPVGPMTSNPSQQDQSCSCQPQPQQHTPIYSQSDQSQSSSSQSRSFESQADTDDGHSHSPPVTYSAMRRSRRVSRCPVGPKTSSPCQQQGDQLRPSQPQAQQSVLSYSQPYQPQTSCNPPPYQAQTSSRQLHPSQLQTGADTSSAGCSHFPPPTDSATGCCGCVPRCQVGPMTSGPSQQPQDQSGLSQPQPQQAPPSCSQPNQPQQSSSQSHPSLPESSTDTDTADFVSTRRKTRGPTRCLSLWGRQEGERISVPTNKLGQPIGRLAPKLSNFLGTIARNGHVAPLTYVDWRGMPDASKEKMWQLVLSKVDISPSGRTWVLQSLGKKWKDWKSQLKAKHYYPHQTDEERLADRDERVLPDQWAILIAFWNSEEGQERTATNRANRAQQKLRHTLGTKSLARLCEEERAKRPNGEEPTWEELFILTHTRKDGQPVDEASAAAISQLCKQTAQQSKTTQGSTPLDDSQVMGEYMTMHNFEDPSPSNIRGRKPSRAEALRMATEAKRLADEEVRRMRERMETMEQKYSYMEAQMAKMMSTIQMGCPDKHISESLGTKEALDASNSPEDSPLLQVHSSSSSHPVPSHELLYQLHTHTKKKGKTRHRSTSRVAHKGRDS